jgi:hypothetical protein
MLRANGVQAFEGYGLKLVMSPAEQPTMTVQFEMEREIEEEPSTLADLFKHPSLFPNGTPDFE